MQLPNFSTYCENTTKVNALVFDLGNGVHVYFSYQTPVAFRAPGVPLTVRRNEWGPTTGKHLNAIDGGDKKGRVDGDTFAAVLATVLNGATLPSTAGA